MERGSVDRVLAAPGLLLLTMLALQACDSAGTPAGTLHSDSAGVAIATALEPLWESGDGWTVSDEPLVEIGAAFGASEYQLDSVVGVVRLGNGDIVIGERFSGELRGYDREGVFMWRAAGSGDGPGEHRRLISLHAFAGDSLVTFDIAQDRLQVFAPGGEFVRALRVEGSWPGFSSGSPIGVSGHRLVIDPADYSRIPEGVVRWPAIRLATLSLEDGTIAALLDVPGGEQFVERLGEGVVYQGYEFAKGPVFAAEAGRLAVADTEAYAVRWVSTDDGSITRILRRDEPIRPVTSVHVEAWLDEMAERNMTYNRYTREQAEAAKPGWRDRPRAETLPALRSIHLDATGHLWVEPYFGPGVERSPFEVYAPDGTWLGSISMPPGLDRGATAGSAPHLEIGDDYVLGVWRDAQGVEYVRLYRLDKS
ncbi:hypothetical protein [Candidatus Palauibacter sp.]|uniref:hypothetical protein n=1 Tax=Candidatus Palauibacter sp. TaxID=3101350 RepID=UPI003AF2D9AA